MLAALSQSRPPEHRHFTVETGQTAYTFATQCTPVSKIPKLCLWKKPKNVIK